MDIRKLYFYFALHEYYIVNFKVMFLNWIATRRIKLLLLICTRA